MWKLLGIIIYYNNNKKEEKNNNIDDTPVIRRYQQRVWSAAVKSLTVSFLDKATKTKQNIKNEQQNELNRFYAENVLM